MAGKRDSDDLTAAVPISVTAALPLAADVAEPPLTAGTRDPERVARGSALDVTRSDHTLRPGQHVGEWLIEEPIGKGGFGTVYRAIHPIIGKRVAIKLIAWRYASDQEVIRRFVEEARAVNQIQHRNLIDIFSFGVLDDGRYYYVMEYLEGETLEAMLAGGRRLSPAEACQLFDPIARALDAAHAKGIAHRDLKPENIFIAREPDGDRFPVLLDFGIAKLLVPDPEVTQITATGVPIGTPTYMSPEQCRGREIDHRTDIYSLGVVLYRALVGHPPFRGDTAMDLMLAHIEGRPPAAGLGDVLDAALYAMLAKDPDDRPATASLALERLRQALPEPSRRPVEIRARPSLARLGLAMLVALALAGTVAAVTVTRHASGRQAPVAPIAPVADEVVIARPAEGSLVVDDRLSVPPPAPPPPAPPPAAVSRPHKIRAFGFPARSAFTLDGVAIDPRRIAIPRDGKPHRLVVRAAGYRALSREVDETTPALLEVSLQRAPVRTPNRRPAQDRRVAPAQNEPRPLQLPTELPAPP